MQIKLHCTLRTCLLSIPLGNEILAKKRKFIGDHRTFNGTSLVWRGVRVDAPACLGEPASRTEFANFLVELGGRDRCACSNGMYRMRDSGLRRMIDRGLRRMRDSVLRRMIDRGLRRMRDRGLRRMRDRGLRRMRDSGLRRMRDRRLCRMRDSGPRRMREATHPCLGEHAPVSVHTRSITVTLDMSY
jgi:hypothetical protein